MPHPSSVLPIWRVFHHRYYKLEIETKKKKKEEFRSLLYHTKHIFLLAPSSHSFLSIGRDFCRASFGI